MGEKERYEKVWGMPIYRRYSPAVEGGGVSRFLSRCEAEDQTVIDVGCGTGLSGPMLRARGLDVTLNDFASNSIEPALRKEFPFLCCDILDIQGTWDCVCSWDVLEHIPPSEVPAVLAHMISIAREGLYLEISSVGDNMGKVCNVGSLHLTVRPLEWWSAEIWRIPGVDTVISYDAGPSSVHLQIAKSKPKVLR